MDPIIARKLARTANPYPSVVFLAPKAAAAYAAAGLPPGRAGYCGCDAMVMTQAMGDAPAAFVASRAWLAESADSLRARGLIDGDGVATEAARARREAVERQTDLLALAPLEALGEEGCLRLRELIRPMSVAIAGHLLPR